MPTNRLSKRRTFWTLPPVCASKQKRFEQITDPNGTPDTLAVYLTVNVICDPTPFPPLETFTIHRIAAGLQTWKNDHETPIWRARVAANLDLIGLTWTISLSYWTSVQCPPGANWQTQGVLLTPAKAKPLDVGFNFSRIDPDFEPGSIRIQG